MKFGLENISRLCAALDHPEHAFRSLIVAGTNGKGSVTAMVHRGLVAAGHRAARYTSPHLERIEERYVVGGDEIATARLESAVDCVRQAIERLQREGRLESPPTFFECATAAAFELFRREEVEIAVLEVGLGGRLDATNIVMPLAAAITSIDFDHQAQLGHTIESIAFEKAGVVKDGIPVVCGPLVPAAESVVRSVCEKRHARFIRATESMDLERITGGAPLALAGAHQRNNARVAACLLDTVDGLGIRVDAAAIRAGLTDVRWPGRLERVDVSGTPVLLDAAHNPAGARALAGYLREAGWTGCTLVFGVMSDKDVPDMLKELAEVCGRIVCTTAPTRRALPADTAAAMARAVPGGTWSVTSVAEPAGALDDALRGGAPGRGVVVAGSVFLIGSVRGILRAR
jgi:dihydrofolate synthase/folylpolyglutamate synthase